MKWWLIVFVLTSDGMTAFDLEYKSRPECTAALVRTYALRKENADDDEKVVLECSKYPMPARQPENPEIEA